MKIIQVHNRYRVFGGEDLMFEAIVHLLRQKGHNILALDQKSKSIKSIRTKINAFYKGCYSLAAKKTVSSILATEQPDLVHVHNLYPLFSPSILAACRESGVPVVMRCPNYRLICPIGDFFDGAEICERCANGREYWCVLKNCGGNIFESVGYALRTAVARKLRLFQDNVTLYLPPSEFVKRRLIGAGFPANRIIAIPNMSPLPNLTKDSSFIGEYIAYAGQILPQKGIETLVAAATRQPNLSVKFAGDYSPVHGLLEKTPPNIVFLGFLDRSKMADFYRKARILVMPSKNPEVFPLAVLEAMSYGLPVIASRIGGLQEIVEDGVTGVFFEPGNAEDLANKMKFLWESPKLCWQLGRAGRKKAIREYSKNVYYRRLMHVYREAIEINKRNKTVFRIKKL